MSSPGVLSGWGVQEVSAFLSSKGFTHLVSAFRSNGIDGQRLTQLSRAEIDALVSAAVAGCGSLVRR